MSDAYRDAVMRFGGETFAFSGLKPGLSYWHDAPPPEGTGAAVAYQATLRTWVAVGAPVAPDDRVAEAAKRFVAAAREAGKNACFFATEKELMQPMLIGQQPIFVPGAWPATLKRSRSLREQLRRARKKGLVVRPVEADEVAPGTSLRDEIEAMAKEWLDAHHLEPMSFIVEVDPFYRAEVHRYFVAERDGLPVAFLSAVPIPARSGWLVEDVFRAPDAPNGTSECLLDAFFRSIPNAALATLGLAPLYGKVPWYLRFARRGMRPLYDFAGLSAFKRRIHPSHWEPVFLAHPKRRGIWSILASLRAFAGGSLTGFVVRSLVRHPSGPPFVMAVPLVPWTLLLMGLALAGASQLLGFSNAGLWAWVFYDALLAVALYRAARRPLMSRLQVATTLASIDSVLSVAHLTNVGFGRTFWEVSLRTTATLAPILGTLGLFWAMWLGRHRLRRKS